MSTNPTIKFYEIFQEEELLLRRFIGRSFRVQFTSKTIQESKDQRPFPIISIRTQSVIPPAWGKDLQAVITRSQGFDHLHKFLKETRSSAECGYLGEYCARSVAEQAVMMMLMLLRKISRQQENFKMFHRESLTGSECKNKNALIVGAGAIGKEIAGIAKGLKMNVKAVDPVKKNEKLKYVSLKEGIVWADVIFCAADLNITTDKMLNYKTVSKNKKSPVLVNISRGEITPLSDVKRLLDERILKGAALDVFEDEARLADHLRRKKGKRNAIIKVALELKKRDNVILTPHNAFNTHEALERKCEQTVRSLKVYLKKRRFPHRLGKI